MKNFTIRCILGTAMLASSSVFAADLGTFNASCGPAGVVAAQAINGNIGDTFTVQSLAAGLGGCLIASTNAAVATPSIGFINMGGAQVVTLAAAGTTTWTATQTGNGTTFTITVAAAAAPNTASVPTLSEVATLVLAGLTMVFAGPFLRRRKD